MQSVAVPGSARPAETSLRRVAAGTLQTIDTAIYPYAGPCAFCGRPDKRHRMFDAIRENHRAGDSIGMLANLYDLTAEQVEWIVAQPRFPGVRRAPA